MLGTPSNRNVHHGSNVKYLDKNYWQVLIIWDILFGTFSREDNEAPIYGLIANIETSNLIKVEFEGFKWLRNQIKTATNWKDKLGYLINPSGWSPTGTISLLKLWFFLIRTKRPSYSIQSHILN